MGLLDTTTHDEEEEEEQSGDDSGTYIQFVTGPGHRDWNDKHKPHQDDLQEAWEAVAPSAEDPIVSKFAQSIGIDRHVLFAKLTAAIRPVFEDGDFSDILDFLLGTEEDTSDEEVEMYAQNICAYLDDNEAVREEVQERLNTHEEAVADDD